MNTTPTTARSRHKRRSRSFIQNGQLLFVPSNEHSKITVREVTAAVEAEDKAAITAEQRVNHYLKFINQPKQKAVPAKPKPKRAQAAPRAPPPSPTLTPICDVKLYLILHPFQFILLFATTSDQIWNRIEMKNVIQWPQLCAMRKMRSCSQ